MPYQEGRRILRKAQNHAGDQDSYGEVRLDDLDRFHLAPEEGVQVGLEGNQGLVFAPRFLHTSHGKDLALLKHEEVGSMEDSSCLLKFFHEL